VACVSVGVALTIVWLLPAIFRESNVILAHPFVYVHLPFSFDEFLAPLHGAPALVDGAPQYSLLLPYLVAPILSAFGETVGVFTVTMVAFSLVSFVAVYGRVPSRQRRRAGRVVGLPPLSRRLFVLPVRVPR
jgi:hypothetical protein